MDDESRIGVVRTDVGQRYDVARMPRTFWYANVGRNDRDWRIVLAETSRQCSSLIVKSDRMRSCVCAFVPLCQNVCTLCRESICRHCAVIVSLHMNCTISVLRGCTNTTNTKHNSYCTCTEKTCIGFRTQDRPVSYNWLMTSMRQVYLERLLVLVFVCLRSSLR